MPVRCTACALLLFLTACQQSGARTAPLASESVELVRVQQGKLVDLYGLRTLGGAQVVELYRTDVLVGPDIEDEREANSNRPDASVLYDFLSANPDTLQPRLLITREIGSAEFAAAVDRLDDKVRTVGPSEYGRDTTVSPYSIVPRNAALRLEFSSALAVTDASFYERDAAGRVTGVKNTESVQLLEIVGDPTDGSAAGDFRRLPVRIAVRGRYLILDPVFLGSEGLQYGTGNQASGLPEAPNLRGANIRIALATEGPLAFPGLAENSASELTGANNEGVRCLIRDFRSGNAADDTPTIARGFLRDPTPPRLVGEMQMYLERVEEAGAGARLLTIFKNGIEHEIDRGDLLRISVDGGTTTLGSLEVLRDPEDDRGRPAEQRVRVLVRPLVNAQGVDLLEQNDPSERSDFPPFANREREQFLREHAPQAVLVAEFTRLRRRPGNPVIPYYGDDPRNFLSFSPRPAAQEGGVVVPNERVSPFAGAVLRFSKPIDLNTVLALDTAFFATRDVLDADGIAAFIQARDLEPSRFHEAKYRTPHLVHSRVFDESGSQTTIRVQPTLGFYLDEAMRKAGAEDQNKPFADRRFHYFLHLVGGKDGIADLAGNPLDFQAVPVSGQEVVDHLAMEFELDWRAGRFDDNAAVYVVRRFAHVDEDERPSLYLSDEVVRRGQPITANAWPCPDVFGPVTHLPSGELISRRATRVSKYVDNLNQQSPPPSTTPLRWCPPSRVVFQTAATPFGAPIQNPLNPYGCRLQTVWREIDMNLSRTDPLDFNLDVEQLYWAPYTQSPIVFDEFDRMTLYLAHSEFRPEPCINSGSAFPVNPLSGLEVTFEKNYAHNQTAAGSLGRRPASHPAYVDATMTINPSDAILEPNRVHRYLPLPKFIDATKVANVRNPFFVWRDEQEWVQGGNSKSDLLSVSGFPYVLSPFLMGKGRKVTGPPQALQFTNGGWDNSRNIQMRNGRNTDTKTDGCVGTIALPLLADFWVYPDDPNLPTGNPFRATGANGWQISLTVTSSPDPAFRTYSSGRGGAAPFTVDPTHPRWLRARGGFVPRGGRTPPADNSMYWIAADFLKRTAVVTSGFVEIADPHRMPATVVDPRLGPYDVTGRLPTYFASFDPPLSELAPGTGVVAEYRGAGVIARRNQYWPKIDGNYLTEKNFPLDPLKAGDAHIRHWDNREVRGGSTPRRWWTYPYNDTVTSWTADPNDLAQSEWTNQFAGPFETFDAEDVLYFNWRFIMRNNVEADPPVSPKIESFAVSYRLTK